MENEVVEKSSLKSGLKQPKGILKNTHSHSNVNTHPYETTNKKSKSSRGLLWDENNLVTNEINKTPKMKITEPKTPYNKDAYDIIDDDDGNTRARSPEEKEHSEIHWGAFEAAIHKAAQEEQNIHYSSDSDEYSHSKQLEYSYSSGTDSESEEHKKKFANSRKAHYNEYIMMQKWKTKVKDDDDLNEGKDDNQDKMET